MKVVCLPKSGDFSESADIAFSMYSSPSSENIGRVGVSIPKKIIREGLVIDSVSWDFLSIALAVIAADHGCQRKESPDGWTRKIELSVSVQSPTTWISCTDAIEKALRFLTGDIWTIKFVDGGCPPPKAKRQPKKQPSGDIVCLLSGGMDSLVGAIDLVEQGKNPFFVSHVVRGDREKQCDFAEALGRKSAHLQLSHAVKLPNNDVAERSQRARSLIFLAYGLVAATALQNAHSREKIQLVVPENGFISMNVPLTNLRIGSLSTRTTHPHFIRQIQKIWYTVGLKVEIYNPYQFRTKGELLADCKNQEILQKLAGKTTSCGRLNRHGYKQCGRCIPCLVRRASFLKWGKPDKTKYVYKNIRSEREFDDVRSLAVACLHVKERGCSHWVSDAINSAQLEEPDRHMETVNHGIEEAQNLLNKWRIL